jgi:hypothetical protein
VCVWSDHIVGVTELTKALLSCHHAKRGSRWLSALQMLCVLLVGASGAWRTRTPLLPSLTPVDCIGIAI